jgi:hypothetical protein
MESEVHAMESDLSIWDVDFIPKAVADKLGTLEIRTIRQLAARLEFESEPLRN